MPMGATLALRVKARGFMRRTDGAKRRSSVPHGHFASLSWHFVESIGFYTGRNRGCPVLKEGESLWDMDMGATADPLGPSFAPGR
jgi:hypothetical protein